VRGGAAGARRPGPRGRRRLDQDTRCRRPAPGAVGPVAAPATCITRQFSRKPGTVADYPCGACATRHGPAEAPRLSCYARSGPPRRALGTDPPRATGPVPAPTRFRAPTLPGRPAPFRAPITLPPGATFPVTGSSAREPTKPIYRLPRPPGRRHHPTPVAQLARSRSRSETNVSCSVAGTGSSVPVPSAIPPTVVGQSVRQGAERR
jgi:hypothetical protein